MNWKVVIRDSLIFMGLTFLGGIVVGFVFGLLGERASPKMQIGIAFSNILFGIFAFTISGCLVKANRFRHLFFVALVTWLLSLINLFFGYSFSQWLLGAITMLIMMGLGGALSFLFVSNRGA